MWSATEADAAQGLSAGADQGSVKLRCTQCLQVVGDGLGYEAPGGHALCGPCYFALWGPAGRSTFAAATERNRPFSRRPKRRGKTFWIPGPTGETDPGLAGRRIRRPRS
ncbi:MAG: hypothetical protein U0R24_06420 [Solirubrobacterales bacterium]